MTRKSVRPADTAQGYLMRYLSAVIAFIGITVALTNMVTTGEGITLKPANFTKHAKA